MDIKQLANTIAASLTAPIQYGANVNDTGGAVDSQNANIRAVGALSARGDNAQHVIGSIGAGANAQSDAEDAAAQQQKAEAEQKAKDAQDELDYLNDPKNFKAVVNDKGGYDFFSPDGQKISAVDYAKVKNVHITDLYKDSQDPNDKDFTDDYNKVLQLGKILQSGDKAARDKFYKQNPEWQKAYGNTPYNDIVKDLRGEYPGYFRSKQELTTTDQSGASTPNRLAPPDKRSTIQRLKDALNPRR